MTAPAARLWRTFPRDPEAARGEPFSSSHVPPGQGKGRFDLPGSPSAVFYLAESPEHAVAETIQHLRGQSLEEGDLRVAGRRLALVAVTLPDPVREGVADLCDPGVLLRLGVRPDETASRDRRTTQRIAAAVQAAGHPGLRWWSAFSGDWHTVALFREGLAGPFEYGIPEPLSLDHGSVREAARTLGVALGKRPPPRARP